MLLRNFCVFFAPLLLFYEYNKRFANILFKIISLGIILDVCVVLHSVYSFTYCCGVLSSLKMDRKRTKFSLSRKRKKSNTDEQDTTRENSEKVVLSVDETSVESKENHIKTPFTDGKVEPSTHHTHAKKSIATWFKKPSGPKTVPCPMCEKVVILSKINQHLDNNCQSYFGLHNLSSNKTTSKANRLPGLNSHREPAKKENVSGICLDKATSVQNCKVDSKSPRSKDENLSPPSQVSSTLETAVIIDSDVASVEKELNEVNRTKGNCDTLNNGCDVTFDGIAQQKSSSQHSFAKCVAETDKILTQDNGNLQTNQIIDLPSDQSKCSSTEERKESLAEENTENFNNHENTDYEPYYLANFKLVLNNVLSNEDDRKLFNDSDNHVIDTFNGMSAEQQKLYIRLFQRKRGWFRCSKLEYPKINSNLTPILNLLVQKGN